MELYPTGWACGPALAARELRISDDPSCKAPLQAVVRGDLLSSEMFRTSLGATDRSIRQFADLW
jgi:hypothetical protein